MASLVLVMASVPVFLLFVLVSFFEVFMMAVGIRSSLLVVHRLTAPGMAIMVIGVIVSGVNCATRAEPGNQDYQRLWD